MHDPTRKNLAVRARRRDLALYAICGALSVGFAASVLGASPALHRQAAWIAISIAVLALPVVLAVRDATGPRHMRRSWHGLRHWTQYPPAWVAGVLGAALVVVWTLFDPELARSLAVFTPPSPAWGWLVTGVLGVELGAVLLAYGVLPGTVGRTPPATHPATPASACVLLHDKAALLGWIHSDIEISTPDNDAFQYSSIALRIAQRVLRRTPEDLSTASMAVVGDLGAGKSSLQHLTRHYIYHSAEGSDRIEFVSISLWPFDTAEAAVEGVLSALIAALSQRVDISGLAGLPRDYMKAIESLGGPLSSIAPAMSRRASPPELLRGLSGVLDAIEVTLVVWVEDLERFSEAGEERSTEPHGARVAPVRSLLYLLNSMPHICVVMAGRSLDDGFDVEKIARYIERVPQLQPAQVWSIVDTFVAFLRADDRPDLIDPGKDGMHDLFFAGERANMFRFMELEPGDPAIPLALARLLHTPRKLKWALREVHGQWVRLAGEVDFEDLVCVSALKVSAPDVFAWCDAHVSMLKVSPFGRSLPTPQASDRRVARRGAILGALEALVVAQRSQQESDAVRSLLLHLFPHGILQKELANSGSRLQRVGEPSRTDYWSRVVGSEPVVAASSDQTVLSAIDNIPHDRTAAVELLLRSDTAGVVEYFSRRIDRLDILRLLDDVAARGAQKQTASERTASRAAVVSLRLMLKDRPPHPNEVKRFVCHALGMIVSTNIPLAQTIISRFARAEGTVVPILTNEGIADARRLVSSLLAASFGPPNARRFYMALEHGDPYTLHHVAAFAFGDPLDGDYPELWREFASALLAAAHEDPVSLLPCVASFVVKSDYSSSEIRPYEDDDGSNMDVRATALPGDIERLFGTRQIALLFRGATVADRWHPEAARNVRALIHFAGRQSDWKPNA